MAGIYIHIPFCKQACHYCNFHFTTSLLYKNELVNALQKEMELQKHFFENEKIETIYFGGGSPSLLETDEVKRLIDAAFKHFKIDSLKEVTLEANPDDLTIQKIKELKTSMVNRFSLGVQSFFDDDLIWMNRSHNAQQAERAVKAAQDAGFENITLDLIYGTPTLSDENWKQNLQKAIALQVPHISAYGLTVEEKTPLHKLILQRKKENVDENKSAEQMMILIETLTVKGFEHYEISNFAKPNCYAMHNTNYWMGKKYLGIGPSAHSFNGKFRQSNVSNNQQYIEAIKNNELIFEKEMLTPNQQFNEWLMTGLRTQWGCDLRQGRNKFESKWIDEMLEEAQDYFAEKKLLLTENKLKISIEGKLIADKIMSDLMRIS